MHFKAVHPYQPATGMTRALKGRHPHCLPAVSNAQNATSAFEYISGRSDLSLLTTCVNNSKTATKRVWKASVGAATFLLPTDEVGQAVPV